MAGYANAKGNMGLLRKNYKAHVANGELVIGSEFQMTFVSEDQRLTTMIRTTQVPELKRQEIEDVGQGGIMFRQQGAFMNAGQINVTCVENLDGSLYKMIRDCVVNKKHIDVEVKLITESKGTPVKYHEYDLYDCSIGCEALDLSTEDNTVLLKPNLLVTYNWFEPEAGR